MTPEKAIENAAECLDEARKRLEFGEAEDLVCISDAWLRLHGVLIRSL